MNTIKIGQYISALRKARTWTQRQLAYQLNVTHQAVSKWGTGLTLPDIETLLFMSRLFETTMEDILTATPTNHNADNAGNTKRLALNISI